MYNALHTHTSNKPNNSIRHLWKKALGVIEVRSRVEMPIAIWKWAVYVRASAWKLSLIDVILWNKRFPRLASFIYYCCARGQTAKCWNCATALTGGAFLHAGVPKGTIYISSKVALIFPRCDGGTQHDKCGAEVKSKEASQQILLCRKSLQVRDRLRVDSF